MPVNVVKTKADERHWSMAKQRAAEEGHAKDWAYVMGIYKRMSGEKTAAMRPLSYLANLWRQASGSKKGLAEALHARNERKLEEAVKGWKGARDVAVSRVGLREYAADRIRAGVPAMGSKHLDRAQRRAHQGMQRAQAHLDDVAARAQKTQDNLTKAQADSAGAKRKILLGVGGAGAAGYLAHRLHQRRSEEAKTAAEKKHEGVNWRKLLGVAAASGLAMGLSKGWAEKRIERKVTDLLKRRPKLPLRKDLPWAVSRGVTGAASGAAGATSMAIGLHREKKKEEAK
ncbi:MAG: hypothetical protein ABFE07_28060 [Armatimonadia bacterium]